MKKCVNCGNVADSNNSVFCNSCGGKLFELKTAVCKNCNTTVDADSVFCKNCGANMKADYTPSSGAYHGEIYLRDSIDTKKRNNKAVTVMLMVIIAICLVSITAISMVILLNNRDNEESGEQIALYTQEDVELQEKTDEIDETDEVEEEMVEEDELQDYDKDNDDWYRLRKSKWDPATQVGAYKTVKKALEDADRYRSQGYVLYDRDFNEIK